MWHTVAMAASNMLLLDAESGPLRVYVEELKPTPEGDLEILLQKRWVFSPPTWNSPSPGLWTPPAVGCRWDQGPRDGEWGSEALSPRSPAQGRGAKSPSHGVALGSVWGETCVEDAGHRDWAAAARSPVCPREEGRRLEEF